MFFGLVICALIRFLSVLGQSHILEAAVDLSCVDLIDPHVLRQVRRLGVEMGAHSGIDMIFQHSSCLSTPMLTVK